MVLGVFEYDPFLGDSPDLALYSESKIGEPHPNLGRAAPAFHYQPVLPSYSIWQHHRQTPWCLPLQLLSFPLFRSWPPPNTINQAKPVGFLRCLGPSRQPDLLDSCPWTPLPTSHHSRHPYHCPSVTTFLYPDTASHAFLPSSNSPLMPSGISTHAIWICRDQIPTHSFLSFPT